MILKTVLFCWQYVQINSVIYPALNIIPSCGYAKLSVGSPFRNLRERMKTKSKFHWFSFPTVMTFAYRVSEKKRGAFGGL